MTLINSPTEPENKENASKHPVGDEGLKWGYDMYPDRRGNNEPTGISSILQGKGRENVDKIRCERNAYRCVKQSPLIKLMMGALKSAGCALDIRRHISCEECAPTVSGGYDPILNQVVICQNTVKEPGMMQAVLTHEMVHMFDYCKNNLDFKNLDHLACTEIRAANLAHCSFLSAWLNGDIAMFSLKEAHQVCVKNKALSSIVAARKGVDKVEAISAIERVFSRCYADLEPIGRRIRRNSDDIEKAYLEGFYYGYDDTGYEKL